MVKCFKTAALLDLNNDLDISIKKTFEYYWSNSERFYLNYTPFPICNTEGNNAKILKYLNNLYKKRISNFYRF